MTVSMQWRCTASRGAAALVLASTLVLAGCGAVQVAPVVKLPRALVSPIAANVGVVVAGDMRNYSHRETRSGQSWDVALGAGHTKLSQDVFAALFRSATVYQDMAAARSATGLAAIFEPRIEQFSFATAQDTGGSYVAVTIRYRINLFTPAGDAVDSFTLTGYGNSVASGAGGSSLDRATQAAMRDAAAKMLVQFPDQPAAKLLATAQPLVAQASGPDAAAKDPIEAVPIK